MAYTTKYGLGSATQIQKTTADAIEGAISHQDDLVGRPNFTVAESGWFSWPIYAAR